MPGTADSDSLESLRVNALDGFGRGPPYAARSLRDLYDGLSALIGRTNIKWLRQPRVGPTFPGQGERF